MGQTISVKGASLARLRRSLRRHVKQGWARAVFARPGSEDDTQVLNGPGRDKSPSADEIDALLAAAEQAARDGLVKQTIVLDDRTRVRIDARFGKAKVSHLDDEKIAKVMGGKARALRPDSSGELLRVIGIMNADGTISAKNAKKYKQVCHLVELCRPAWERIATQRTIDDAHPLRVLDLGCGNSYLTFVIAEALRLAEVPAHLHGVDTRDDVIERSDARAKALGMSNMSFAVSSIRDTNLSTADGAGPDLVLALHACDTATDEALTRAVQSGCRELFLAPCCQSELAGQLSSTPVRALLRQGLLKRDYAATLTDALRIELLEACGYIVDTVEFVASTHTPKNLLIRAHRRHPDAPVDPTRWHVDRVTAMCAELGVEPTALRLLNNAG